MGYTLLIRTDGMSAASAVPDSPRCQAGHLTGVVSHSCVPNPASRECGISGPWTWPGATPARVTRHPVGQPWGAAWFPDGDRIAYSHEDRLIIRTLQGKELRVFKSPVRGRLVRTPAVSPDGKRIIFQVRRDGAWILDLATGFMSRVLEDPSAEEFTWSPDGKRIAYHSRRSGAWGVWTMAPR